MMIISPSAVTVGRDRPTVLAGGHARRLYSLRCRPVAGSVRRPGRRLALGGGSSIWPWGRRPDGRRAGDRAAAAAAGQLWASLAPARLREL